MPQLRFTPRICWTLDFAPCDHSSRSYIFLKQPIAIHTHQKKQGGQDYLILKLPSSDIFIHQNGRGKQIKFFLRNRTDKTADVYLNFLQTYSLIRASGKDKSIDIYYIYLKGSLFTNKSRENNSNLPLNIIQTSGGRISLLREPQLSTTRFYKIMLEIFAYLRGQSRKEVYLDILF